MIALVLMLLSGGLLLGAWVGYPLLLAVWGARRPRGVVPGQPVPGSISIVIAAYNEEDCIDARLRNLAAVQIPPDGEVLLGCDGCDDRTAALAEAWRDRLPSLRVLDFAQRRGKPAVIKDLVAQARGDILVFSDANSEFRPDALAELLAPLADPGVGGVCGRLVLIDRGTETQEGPYWAWENWAKRREGEIDSCLGANGAIYAIRRHLFWRDMPDSTLVDDFVIGMKVREHGARLVYAPRAVAAEDQPTAVADEWGRRVRIGAGGYQAIWFCRHCLHPRFGFFAVAFLFHKVLRWFTPHLMLVLLASTGGVLLMFPRQGGECAVWYGIAMVCLWAQAVFYCLALVGRLGRGCRRSSLLALPRLCDYFTVMQLAILRGFLRFCLGSQAAAWRRTRRSSVAPTTPG